LSRQETALCFLAKLLQNLQDQTVQANQVIVVDGSDQSVEAEIKQFLLAIASFKTTRSSEKSPTKTRVIYPGFPMSN